MKRDDFKSNNGDTVRILTKLSGEVCLNMEITRAVFASHREAYLKAEADMQNAQGRYDNWKCRIDNFEREFKIHQHESKNVARTYHGRRATHATTRPKKRRA